MIAAVVLAAGSSKRMGEHKLLIRLGEKTVIEHAVDNILASAVDKVVVVTGYNAPPVRKVLAERGRETALKSGRLKVVHNPHYEEGQATSLRAGLEELGEHVQAILFCLGDQPFVTPDTINTLVRTFREKKPLVVYPEYRGRRGNPVLFSAEMRPRLLLLKGDEGGRSLLDEAKKCTVAVQTECRGVLIDLDQPEDIERAIEYYRQQAKIARGNNFAVETLFQNMD